MCYLPGIISHALSHLIFRQHWILAYFISLQSNTLWKFMQDYLRSSIGNWAQIWPSLEPYYLTVCALSFNLSLSSSMRMASAAAGVLQNPHGFHGHTVLHGDLQRECRNTTLYYLNFKSTTQPPFWSKDSKTPSVAGTFSPDGSMEDLSICDPS